LESGSEGGQKFLPPNPLPFCPPERLDFRIKNSDFRQKKFEHQSKNTSVNNVNAGEKEANCFASGRDEKGFFLEGKSLARRGIPLSPHRKKIGTPEWGLDFFRYEWEGGSRKPHQVAFAFLSDPAPNDILSSDSSQHNDQRDIMRTTLNIISTIVGSFASLQLPSFIQKRLNALFVHVFDVDMAEFDRPEDYPSIQALFTRSLRKQRPFSDDPNELICPTDSTVAQFGTLDYETILQAKGLSYDLPSFLTDAIDTANMKRLENGTFINFYLSPKEYHHFHAPTDFMICKMVHVPGTLLPVKKSSLEKNRGLFIRNERVILECISGDMLFYFVAIGALNVGKIRLFREPNLQTNIPGGKNSHTVYDYPDPIRIRKGEDMGVFEMGSSVVLLFEKDRISFSKETEIRKDIMFGNGFADRATK
jgi:phosphatidylserine decarboxylase